MMAFLTSNHLEVPAEAMVVELQQDDAGTIAWDPGSAGSHQVVFVWVDGAVDMGARNHTGGGPRVDQELHPAQLVDEPKEGGQELDPRLVAGSEGGTGPGPEAESGARKLEP